MNQREIKKHAKKIVLRMLNGRCLPEEDDVMDLYEATTPEGKVCDPQEIEALMLAVQEVLDGLCKKLQKELNNG